MIVAWTLRLSLLLVFINAKSKDYIKLNLHQPIIKQVMRNLGIISSFSVGQKCNLLQASDYMWQEGLEPEHSSELALYKFKYLKLNLRLVAIHH